MKQIICTLILLVATSAMAYPPQNTPHNRWQNRPHNQWQNRPYNNYQRPYYHPPYSFSPPYRSPYRPYYEFHDYHYRRPGIYFQFRF